VLFEVREHLPKSLAARNAVRFRYP
jgi:hypothetical protein